MKWLSKSSSGVARGRFDTIRSFRHNHTNPPDNHEPAWDSPTTRHCSTEPALTAIATNLWPWYSNVAQFLAASARRQWRPQPFEFHRLGPPQRHAKDVDAQVNKVTCALFYLPMHRQPAHRGRKAVR